MKDMKARVLALTLLLLLLTAPLTPVTHAEDPVAGGDADIEVIDGDGNDGGNGEEEGDGGIDPLVYQQIRETTEARWWHLYHIYTDQLGGEGDGEAGNNDAGDYDGPVIPGDLDPELRNMLINAWMELTQAAEMERENLQAAAQQHLRVMRVLRNTWRRYQEDNPEVVDDITEALTVTGGGNELPPVPTEEELTETQQKLVNSFQRRFNESIKEMFQFYNEVEDDLDPDDAVKAYNTLYNAEQKLLRIQERIAAGDIEGAINDLDDVGEGLEEGFDDMEDPQSAQLFKTAAKLQAKLEKMIEKKERKTAQGEDTSLEDMMINQLRGNMSKAKDIHKENKGKGNNGNDKVKPKKEQYGSP